MDWIPLMIDPHFLSHLGSRMDDWETLRQLAGIIAPIVIMGGIYALGVFNPALGFAAGAAISIIKQQYSDLARDTLVQSYADHRGKLVSTLGGAASELINALSIGQAYAESGERLAELLAARAQELNQLNMGGKAYVETSATGLTVHAPTGSSRNTPIVLERKLVDFETLSRQSGVPVESLIKMLTGGK